MGGHPVADFGQFSLLGALLATVFAGAAAAVAARQRSRRLLRAAIQATYGSAALLSLASAMIFFAILANDYSIKYVQRYSDATMPWYYKMTSYWGGLDGSMMFWAWLLALFAALAVYVNRERHREILPWAITVLMTVLAFFLLLLIFEKRPFDTFFAEAPGEGKGLNPLLQDPYMAFHPPALYVGLVACAVPFAFGIGALASGNLDDSWLRSMRRWVLAAWFFLSLGLVLGMLWAYTVLGWGGYWGWDPVENAGALAWFTTTAYLHSVIVQERRGMLKLWNVFLVITSFELTMVATFLTRSGFVQSVHAFGSDPVLKVTFLAFIAGSSVLGYGLMIYRLPLLRSRGSLDSWVSREFAFLVNNWILLVSALFILLATMFPSLSEAVTGVRVNLATPFYTQWMTPLGLILLFLTGVGPLIAWHHSTPKNLIEQFTIPLIAGLVTAGGLALVPGMAARTPIFHEHLELPVAVINFGLCAFVLVTILQEFYRDARVRQAHTGTDLFTALVGLVARNKRRYGGYVVHVGIVLMFIGFAGGAYKRESEVTLEQGQQTTLGQYTLRFTGLTTKDTMAKRIVAADLELFRGGSKMTAMGSIQPAKWYFPNREEEPVTHVVVDFGVIEDLYIVLNGFDVGAKLINLKIVLNPLVNWIWFGFALLCFGTAICFSPERAYQLAAQQAKVVAREAAQGARAGGSMPLLLLGLALLGASPGAHADEKSHDTTVTIRAAPRTKEEREIFRKIVCMCGTCGRELLTDCTCSTADKMRRDISGLLGSGKSVAEVVDIYVQRYPSESPLAMPVDTGFNRLAWALPYGGVLLGVGGLVLAARRMTRRRAAHGAADAGSSSTNAVPSTIAAAKPARDDDYENRLDDELADLD